MTLFKFLFYCLYRFHKFIPRKEQIDHKLASSMLSLSLWLNIVSLTVISVRFIYPLGIHISKFITVVIFFCLFLLCHFLCKNIIIKNQYYKKIVEYYDQKYAPSFKLIGLIGIIYYLISSLIFGWLAYYLSK